MLNFVGTLGAKALSFPGIQGLAAGMTTRSFVLAAILGALIGVGVAVGIVAGCLGCAIRRKGVRA